MSPIVAGFLWALPISIIIIIIVIWLANRYEKKLDAIKIDEDVKNKILNNEAEREKFNNEIYPILKKHREYTLIIGSIIFISATIIVIIINVVIVRQIIGYSILLYTMILIINFILLSKWAWPNMKYVLEVIKLEEETQRRILSEKNQRLLFLEAKQKRKKIQFVDEKESFINSK